MQEFKKRKLMRLHEGDYDTAGAYFITICTQNKRCMLSHIVGTGVPDGPSYVRTSQNGDTHCLHEPVGTGVPDGPSIQLLPYGKVAEKYIQQLNDFYSNISVDHYVIMPNHIHLLLSIIPNDEYGPSGTPVPTVQNSLISRFISTFKRFCNKEYGKNIWQYRSYDHIIRNQEDYDKHVNYILENPMRWRIDELYVEGVNQ